ncbi:MAG: efflux RND transporter permease subunit [Deltaproteobacteria bacterium]|nr:efflux RND transporter permease subunit [Deltaproteobacteria bacterium]
MSSVPPPEPGAPPPDGSGVPSPSSPSLLPPHGQSTLPPLQLEVRKGTLAGAAVRHGITTLMLYIVAVGFGFYSLSNLGLDMYPDVSFPLCGIITTYEGASPEDMEELVSRRIEEAAASVKGVSEITSTSKQGASVVLVEFEWGYDINQGEIDLRKALDFVRDFLPPDASDPLTFAFNPSLQPIQFLYLSGNYDQAQLRQLATRDIEPLIERLPGVAAADTYGGMEREIQVRILPERLRSYRITVQQIVQTLRTENVQIPSGTLEQGGQEFAIQSEGRFSSVEQVGEIVVGYKQAGFVDGPLGQRVATPAARMVPIRLRDVAEVVDGYHETTRVVRTNGEPALFVAVRKQSGANTVQAADAVRAALPDISRRFPSVKLDVFFDQSDFIKLSLGNLVETGWQALVFTFLVIFIFLVSIRGSLVVTISIPISIIVTFAVMNQLGLTLNILSMAGLALAIGMLVDNSIVVLENIQRLVERGMEPKAAAIRGAAEVTMAVTASTLTTIAVFAPIPFVPGIAGLLFRDMAWTIVVSLTASLVVSVTLTPLLASWILARDTDLDKRRFYRRWIHGGIDRVRDAYARLLHGVVRFRKTTALLAIVALVVTAASAFRGLGFDFFPKSDQGFSIFQAEAPVGTSLEETDRRFLALERIAQTEVPEVELSASDIGTGESWAAMFSKGQHSGILRIKYKPLRERSRYQKDLEKDLIERFDRVAGLEVTVFQPSFFGSAGDIELQIYGDDLEQARAVGMDLKKILEEIKGTADVTFSMDEGKPEYRVRLDRERMAALGVPVIGVTNTIQTFFQGVIASRFREGANDYNILVRAPRERRLNVRELQQLPISTLTGKQIPLSSVASIEPSIGPTEITRKNQQRYVTLAAAVPGENLGGVVDQLQKALDEYKFPPDFTYHVGGTAEDLRDTQRYMSIALLVAILLVYMVMASQFESLLEPFIILFTMPMGVIGVAVTFLMTGMTMSVPAIIGIVILVGIVVNNGIVLVDRANQSHREEGKALIHSAVEAGRLRFRPVLMTALTTIVGMVPLAAEVGEGAETWAPMAKTIIGGLTAATFLTLFLVPALWVMFVGFSERWAEHGMLRLIPAYNAVWAFVCLAGGAAAVVFSGRPEAPPELAANLAAIVAAAVVFAGALVAGAIGVYKRRVWGWWTAAATWAPVALAGIALVVAGVFRARPDGLLAMILGGLPGAVAAVLGLAVVRPLWKRRKEFHRREPEPPAAPAESKS